MVHLHTYMFISSNITLIKIIKFNILCMNFAVICSIFQEMTTWLCNLDLSNDNIINTSVNEAKLCKDNNKSQHMNRLVLFTLALKNYEI